jgi:hypothetical protein
MNEHSISVVSDMGWHYSYNLDNVEEIKQEIRH